MDFEAFRIDLTYTDEELSAYEVMTVRHQQAQADRYTWYSWSVLATGAFAALVVAILALALGLADRNTGGLVAVLVFAGFYLGILTPQLWDRVLQRRTRQESWAKFRATWADTTLTVASRGIRLRGPGYRVTYARAAIERTSRDSGFILIWVKAAIPLAIPVRLLTPAQETILLALVRPPA
ncbi:MAG TPA: hypothetical protein VJR58_04315 [Vineibacter sp.]|nr:hypothetical protein [Vineibacter sp.]